MGIKKILNFFKKEKFESQTLKLSNFSLGWDFLDLIFSPERYEPHLNDTFRTNIRHVRCDIFINLKRIACFSFKPYLVLRQMSSFHENWCQLSLDDCENIACFGFPIFDLNLEKHPSSGFWPIIMIRKNICLGTR